MTIHTRRLWVYDPGQTTGWALFVQELGDEWVLEAWGENQTWHGIRNQIMVGDEVIYEDAVGRSPSFIPIGHQVIGVILERCSFLKIHFNAISPSKIHGPSRWGLFEWDGDEKMSQHEKDAIMHGVVYLSYHVRTYRGVTLHLDQIPSNLSVSSP